MVTNGKSDLSISECIMGYKGQSLLKSSSGEQWIIPKWGYKQCQRWAAVCKFNFPHTGFRGSWLTLQQKLDGQDAVPGQLFFLLFAWTWTKFISSLAESLMDKHYIQLAHKGGVKWYYSLTSLVFPRRSPTAQIQNMTINLDHFDSPTELQGKNQVLVFFLSFEKNQAFQPMLFLFPVFPFWQHFHLLPTAKVPDFNCSWAHKEKTT